MGNGRSNRALDEFVNDLVNDRLEWWFATLDVSRALSSPQFYIHKTVGCTPSGCVAARCYEVRPYCFAHCVYYGR